MMKKPSWIFFPVPAYVAFISFLLSSLSQQLQAQKSGQDLVDSLRLEIPKLKEDTGKALKILTLAGSYWTINYDSSIQYAGQGLALSKKLGWKRGQAISFNIWGRSFGGKGINDSALYYYDKALPLFIETNNKIGEASVYNGIGLIYVQMSNYPLAMNYFLRSKKTNESINNTAEISINLANIGLVYHYQSDYEKCLYYYKKALELDLIAGNKYKIAIGYNNLGSVYRELGKYDSAISYLEESYKLYDQINSANGKALALQNTGKVYALQHNYKKAIAILEESLQVSMDYKHESYSAIAGVYLDFARDSSPDIEYSLSISRKEAVKRAIFYFSESLKKRSSLKVGTAEISGIYKSLSDAYTLAGDYYNALEMHKLYVQYKDSIYNAENAEKIARLVVQSEFEKKQMADSLRNLEEKRVSAVQLKRQKTFTYASVIVVILLLALSILIYFYYKQAAKQKQKTERLRLSRDLHDDIGSTLSSMGMYSKIAIDKLQSQNSHEAFEVLDKMNNLSHKMSDQMNDLVWNINPDNDSLQQAADRMKLIAARVLEPQGITYEFNTAGMKDDVQLSIEQRKNLLLVFKEAVNNIIKYARCSQVNIALAYSNKQVLLTLNDDGIGFDLNQDLSGKAGGNGIKNMQARMEQLGGKFTIMSATGKGTSITASFDC